MIFGQNQILRRDKRENCRLCIGDESAVVTRPRDSLQPSANVLATQLLQTRFCNCHSQPCAAIQSLGAVV